MNQRPGLGSVGLMAIALTLPLGWSAPAAANTPLTTDQIQILFAEPLDMRLFRPNSDRPLPANIVTSRDVSQVGLTLPSLWWAQQQYGGRLLENWAAFPAVGSAPPRVDVAVNEQVWGIYDYIERYSFVSRFGTEAQSYGYVTRVFNRQGELLSAFLCDYRRLSNGDISVQDNCTILLNSIGSGGLASPASQGIGASYPTTVDIAAP